MTPKPKLQVTGYRGVWGDTLNEQIAFEYARSFARFIKSKGGDKILLARDARPSGPAIWNAIKEAMAAEGIGIINAGIIPTPSTLLLVKKLNLPGGIMITASHNPSKYNGIKFVVQGGRLTNEREVEEILKHRDSMSQEEKTPALLVNDVPDIDNTEFQNIHIQEILKNIDTEAIRAKKFKVTIDVINGAGAKIAPRLLEELGCKITVLNKEQDGTFAHEPEPLIGNMGQIMEETAKNNSDIGFALDPDADRLAIIDEKGNYISEEHTLVFVVKNILAKTPGPIVINIQTSNMSEDVANNYGQITYRAKVGEANVINKMIEVGAPIGGEGGGGGIYPKINSSRDSLVCMALVLELLARENKKISEITESLPKYFILKEKIPADGHVDVLYAKLKNAFSDAKLDEMDGVRFDFGDRSWISIRASITEPIVRIFSEASTKERAEELMNKARLTLDGK